MNQPTGTEPSHSFANIFKKHLAMFFSDLFGLKYLKNYIGAINIFASLPSMMETSPVSDVPSVGAAEEDGLRGDRQLTAAESDPRIEPALIWLRKWSRIFAFSSFVQLQYANERLTVEGEIKSISQTLGADLLEHIRSAFCNVCREHESSTEATGQVDRMKYDRQLDTASMLQDIKTLQVKFEATNDEDEQQTLEEDITGKILWLLWCGICADVDELLPKVVDFIRKEEGMKDHV
ncbi:hypothetical protein EDD16DRAFT_983939 [Pisolithus croceorrhizus]|nr:hypothetical protein EDD16DRAFT_983939 [Pisolithus croceorrhizus]